MTTSNLIPTRTKTKNLHSSLNASVAQVAVIACERLEVGMSVAIHGLGNFAWRIIVVQILCSWVNKSIMRKGTMNAARFIAYYCEDQALGSWLLSRLKHGTVCLPRTRSISRLPCLLLAAL
ncbi:hypothetical protein HGRIS_014906 [Hohenbuehelia grisea]|uniref:Uncharacterized protein n=1 Tax=Hohenbuehelia grisea TaxID=104357 RepID=A0ABR3JR19_9AGAR